MVSVSMEKRKAEMKPLTLWTHGVQFSSPRWSRSPLRKRKNRWEMEEDEGGEKTGRFIIDGPLLCVLCSK